jgi:phosphoacetylglucosamine mutase
VKGCIVIDYDVQTTPILHYLVKCENDTGYGESTIKAYYKMLSDGYLEFVCDAGGEKVWIDCANGVGAIAAKQLGEGIKGVLMFELFNADVDDASLLNMNVRRPE